MSGRKSKPKRRKGFVENPEVSHLRKGRRVIAIAVADIHLSHTPPLARSVEPDWYEAMARPLRELCQIHKLYRHVPVLCAGDIFDYWNPPVELVGFALDHLPRMYAVPGQHDLPYHDIDAIKRTGFYVLNAADRINSIGDEGVLLYDDEGKDLLVFGFGWGSELRTTKTDPEYPLQIALVHEYCWMSGHTFKDAPEQGNYKRMLERLKGHDFMIFGDNHKGFRKGKVLNCGSLMRRHIDQVPYKPTVGLLLEDGDILRWSLDCSEDKFIDETVLEVAEKALARFDISEMLAELREMGESGLNFIACVQQFIKENNVSSGAGKEIMRILDHVRSKTR